MRAAMVDYKGMTRFEKYQELTLESVVAYSTESLNEEFLYAEDVSDGNINQVFRVFGHQSTVIVKQALPYLRVAGKTWPLTRHRIITEHLAYSIHASLTPEILPEIYHFNQEMSVIIMEDLQGFEPWREALISDFKGMNVPKVVAQYCSEILVMTSKLVLDEFQHLTIKEKFHYTELCLVTEELFFTAPYMPNKTNRYEIGLQKIVDEVQSDEALRAAASEMRTIFKSKDQALIHGDLHSGSIMVSNDQTRIIDLEFSFYGPYGFDLGVLFANLALSRIAHEVLEDFEYTLIIDNYANRIWEYFLYSLERLSIEHSFSVEAFLADMEHDMHRFAGMEMIRRIIGLAHAKEIDSLPDAQRMRGQLMAIENGKALLVNSFGFNFERFWKTATREVNKI